METPLHMAAKTGFPIVVKYLIDSGADVTIKNKENKLPKEVAGLASIAQLFPEV